MKNHNDLGQGIDLPILRKVAAASPFSAWLGASPLVCEGGEVEFEVLVRRDMTQLHGYVHGGVIGAVADNACAWAAASLVGPVLTTEYKINFLNPALGEKIIGRGKVLKASRRLLVCRSDVYAVHLGVEKHAASALATIVPAGSNRPTPAVLD